MWPPDAEKQNPRLNDDRHHHRTGVEQKDISEGSLNTFDNIKTSSFVNRKLQQRFGLLRTTALVVGELALLAGYSR